MSIDILNIGVPIAAYLIIFLWQRKGIYTLTSAINTQGKGIDAQKSAIDAQTGVVNALKSQADGQVALTTRLEAIVDRTERHATTVLTNHEKLIKLVEDRAEKEKLEINKQLEEARSQLLLREESIKGADVAPQLASLLTSLSQENFATKEMIAKLRTDLVQALATQYRPEPFNMARYIARIGSASYRAHLDAIYENLPPATIPNLDNAMQFLKVAL